MANNSHRFVTGFVIQDKITGLFMHRHFHLFSYHLHGILDGKVSIVFHMGRI